MSEKPLHEKKFNELPVMAGYAKSGVSHQDLLEWVKSVINNCTESLSPDDYTECKNAPIVCKCSGCVRLMTMFDLTDDTLR